MATRVEELGNFPFKDFKEFRKAYLEGIITPGVHRGVALDWAMHGLYASGALRLQVIVLSWLPYVAGVGLVVYAILTKTWLLLLGLPVLAIGGFFFHPSAAFAFGFIRTAFILLTFAVFVWALLTGRSNWLALTAALLVIWYAARTVYRKATSHLINAIMQHEDLLCALWAGKALNVRFYNGDSYWADWKVEGGRTVHYE